MTETASAVILAFGSDTFASLLGVSASLRPSHPSFSLATLAVTSGKGLL
jgi:hypothetical protein